jgi:hypothetical protein
VNRVAMLVVAVAAACAPDPSESESFWVSRVLVACAVVAVALGLYNQLDQASWHWPDFAHRDDLKQLDELDKTMAKLANANGWDHPGFPTT